MHPSEHAIDWFITFSLDFSAAATFLLSLPIAHIKAFVLHKVFPGLSHTFKSGGTSSTHPPPGSQPPPSENVLVPPPPRVRTSASQDRASAKKGADGPGAAGRAAVKQGNSKPVGASTGVLGAGVRHNNQTPNNKVSSAHLLALRMPSNASASPALMGSPPSPPSVLRPYAYIPTSPAFSTPTRSNTAHNPHQIASATPLVPGSFVPAGNVPTPFDLDALHRLTRPTGLGVSSSSDSAKRATSSAELDLNGQSRDSFALSDSRPGAIRHSNLVSQTVDTDTEMEDAEQPSQDKNSPSSFDQQASSSGLDKTRTAGTETGKTGVRKKPSSSTARSLKTSKITSAARGGASKSEVALEASSDAIVPPPPRRSSKKQRLDASIMEDTAARSTSSHSQVVAAPRGKQEEEPDEVRKRKVPTRVGKGGISQDTGELGRSSVRAVSIDGENPKPQTARPLRAQASTSALKSVPSAQSQGAAKGPTRSVRAAKSIPNLSSSANPATRKSAVQSNGSSSSSGSTGAADMVARRTAQNSGTIGIGRAVARHPQEGEPQLELEEQGRISKDGRQGEGARNAHARNPSLATSTGTTRRGRGRGGMSAAGR